MVRFAILAFATALVVGCSDDGGPNVPTSPSPMSAQPQRPVIESFTLSAADGEISYSSPLASLSQGDSGFSNVVEFWLDRGPNEDGIAMGLAWFPGDRWGVYTFTPVDGFVTEPVRPREIAVGGDFHTVTVARGQGFSEWLLDGESVVVIDKTRRTVFARVVGTRTMFEYEVPPDFSSQAPPLRFQRFDELVCGGCRLR